MAISSLLPLEACMRWGGSARNKSLRRRATCHVLGVHRIPHEPLVSEMVLGWSQIMDAQVFECLRPLTFDLQRQSLKFALTMGQQAGHRMCV